MKKSIKVMNRREYQTPTLQWASMETDEPVLVSVSRVEGGLHDGDEDTPIDYGGDDDGSATPGVKGEKLGNLWDDVWE